MLIHAPSMATADLSSMRVLSYGASPISDDLLLKAKATAGNGLFTHVQFIQRLNTVGGSVPAGGCRSEQAGQLGRAPYTADYAFYGARN